MTSLAMHCSGDYIVIGSQKKILCYDMALNPIPHDEIKYQDTSVNVVTFHSTQSLLVSVTNDGKCQVFYAMVNLNLTERQFLNPVDFLVGYSNRNCQKMTACFILIFRGSLLQE